LRIAVSTTGPDLDAKIADRFGSADYLLIIDLPTMEMEALSVQSAS